MLYTDSY